jgi:hypothetical protein
MLVQHARIAETDVGPIGGGYRTPSRCVIIAGSMEYE